MHGGLALRLVLRAPDGGDEGHHAQHGHRQQRQVDGARHAGRREAAVPRHVQRHGHRQAALRRREQRYKRAGRRDLNSTILKDSVSKGFFSIFDQSRDY